MKPHPPTSSAPKAKPSTKAAPVARKARAAATSAAPAAPADAQPEPGQREEMVRAAAYRHYEARGCVDGHELEDWLRAEADVERAFASGDSIEPATH